MSKLRISQNGAVVTLTLNRPEVRNALDRETYLALIQALVAAEAQTDVAVIVVHGEGGHFSAGNDLHDFRQPRDPGESAGIRFLRQLAATTKPVVAALEGSAVGIGVTLLLHVDFVYVDPSAVFRLPFVPLGLCPEGASSVLLPRLVGARKATDWILTGRAFDAREAFESGMATAITEPGEALATAQGVARELAELPPDALRLAKSMLARTDRAMIDEALGYEAQRFAERLQTTEAQQAFARFFARAAKR